jgi:hypothetical protein
MGEQGKMNLSRGYREATGISPGVIWNLFQGINMISQAKKKAVIWVSGRSNTTAQGFAATNPRIDCGIIVQIHRRQIIFNDRVLPDCG